MLRCSKITTILFRQTLMTGPEVTTTESFDPDTSA